MKTGMIKFIIENYFSIFIMSVLIIILLVYFGKIQNDKSSTNNIKYKKNINYNFLPNIDLVSSRIGGLVIVLFLLIWFFFRENIGVR